MHLLFRGYLPKDLECIRGSLSAIRTGVDAVISCLVNQLFVLRLIIECLVSNYFQIFREILII